MNVLNSRNWGIKDAAHLGDRKTVNQVNICGMEGNNILIILAIYKMSTELP
jgi:hypothetical protein